MHSMCFVILRRYYQPQLKEEFSMPGEMLRRVVWKRAQLHKFCLYVHQFSYVLNYMRFPFDT